MEKSEFRCFKFPRGGEFSIPTDGWMEAGMEGFEHGFETSYRFASSQEICLVPVEDVAPPSMDRRQHFLVLAASIIKGWSKFSEVLRREAQCRPSKL
jgi:hypothetical protein